MSELGQAPGSFSKPDRLEELLEQDDKPIGPIARWYYNLKRHVRETEQDAIVGPVRWTFVRAGLIAYFAAREAGELGDLNDYYCIADAVSEPAREAAAATYSELTGQPTANERGRPTQEWMYFLHNSGLIGPVRADLLTTCGHQRKIDLEVAELRADLDGPLDKFIGHQ
jgi:hypothetical protein